MDQKYQGILNSFEIFISGRKQFAEALQDIMVQETTFGGAVEQLKETDTDTLGYVIMASGHSDEAAIISKDLKGFANVENVSDEHWKIVATNVDVWNPDIVSKQDESFVIKREYKRYANAN